MSKLPITHCEHGIDRAYRCIDCIEAERNQLRAQVEELDRRLHEANFGASVLRLSRGHAQRELASLRASIAALADEWDAMAKRQRDQAEWDRRDRPYSAASKYGRAIDYEACARELRKLGAVS